MNTPFSTTQNEVTTDLPTKQACPFPGHPNTPLETKATTQRGAKNSPSPQKPVRKVTKHGTLSMTADAFVKGFGREDGLIARLKGHEFSRFRTAFRNYVGIEHPDDIEHVLVKNRDNFNKGPDYEPLTGVLGLGLFTDDGKSWSRHRELLNPVFHKKYLNGLIDKMIDPIQEERDRMDRLPDNQPVEMVQLMTDMTLEVVGNSLFSQSFKGYLGEDASKTITKGLRLGMYLSRVFLLVDPPKWMSDTAWAIMHSNVKLPPPLGQFQSIQHRFNNFVDAVINDRIENPVENPDVLNLMLSASDDQGKLTPARIRAEGITLMLAGHETTANGLCWFWYLLAKNPEARGRMLEEIDTVLQGRTPTLEDLPKLQWTMACFDEALRIYPPVWMITRQALEDDIIGGNKVKAGTTVLIPICNIHHNPRWWPEPEKFDPSRFLPGADKRPSFSYIAFGGGRRICIGRSFSLMEVGLIIAMLSQRYVFDMDPGEVVEAETTFTLVQKND